MYTQALNTSEVEDRKRSEAAAAQTLADEGHLVRLWQASVGTGRINAP